MEKNVLNYFNSQNHTSRSKAGVVSRRENSISNMKFIKRGVTRFLMDYTPYYAKDIKNSTDWGAFASSRLYNKIGLPTPPQFVLQDPSCTQGNHDYIISQDVCSIQDLMATLACIPLERPLEKLRNRFIFPIIKNGNGQADKWELVYNQKLQKYFLKYMTPECLDAMIGMFTLDEIRTDVDRHSNNYFLTKSEGSDKFDGVVVIDLNNMHILRPDYQPNKQGFSDFIQHKYQSYTPWVTIDRHQDYPERIRKIIDMIHNNQLSDKNVNLLRSALAEDFTSPLTEISKNPQIKLYHEDTLNHAYELSSRLWEYNQQTLGRELEL